MFEFRLPSLGSDMDQGKLLEWKVKPGDTVKRGDVVAVVDTSKAAVDVEIWQPGTVQELIVKPGATVPVGTVLATLLAPDDAMVAATAGSVSAAGPAGTTTAPSGRRRISPAARRRAEELRVDVGSVTGTGPDGTVTLQDVEQAAGALSETADRPGGMRKAIAAAMSRSKREIPHYYLAYSIPLERATAWLQEENGRRPLTGRLLMAVLFLKAVARACRRYPEMNGFFRDGSFQASEAVHVGVAISLRPGGLIAPAIHDVADKSPDELMRNLADLVQRTRAGSLRSSEMSDATITVTNLGDQGVDSVFGVIYPPQVALVGFGCVREQPWAEQGTLRAVPVVNTTVAADHRVSDGHRGAQFLAEIREQLQHPEEL